MEAFALTEARNVGLSFPRLLVSLRSLSTEGIAGGVCEGGSSKVLNMASNSCPPSLCHIPWM